MLCICVCVHVHTQMHMHTCANLLVDHDMHMEVREQPAGLRFFLSTVCFTELNINTCYQYWKPEPIPIEPLYDLLYEVTTFNIMLAFVLFSTWTMKGQS